MKVKLNAGEKQIVVHLRSLARHYAQLGSTTEYGLREAIYRITRGYCRPKKGGQRAK